MKKLILDTNFLFIPFLQKVDIFSEFSRIIDSSFEIFVLDKTIEELEGIIAKQKGKSKDAAAMAIKLIERMKIRVLKTKRLYMKSDSKSIIVDDIIAEIADTETIVATQDRELRARLEAKNIKVIILRSKKHLEIT